MGGRPYFTPEFKSERNQQIWQLYNDGSTLSDIGNAVSLSKRRVEDILAQLRRQYGATQRRYKPLSDRNQAILDLYEQGMPAGEIAATIHVRREIVKKTINYYVPDPDL